MEKPVSLSFTDLDLPIEHLFKHVPSGPMSPTWTRVQFTLPDPYDSVKIVEDWLKQNCPGSWTFYTYSNPGNKKHDFIMVIRFEDKNDAILFKLRGGHQSWESK